MQKSVRPDTQGFTLLELLVAIAIIGIIVAFAYPSYMNYIRKGRRQTAINALNALQLDEEHYRANHPTYGTLNQLQSAYGDPVSDSAEYYTLAIELTKDSSGNVTGYIATATAKPGTTQVDDTAGNVSCAKLAVNQNQAIDSDTLGPLSTQKACWEQ